MLRQSFYQYNDEDASYMGNRFGIGFFLLNPEEGEEQGHSKGVRGGKDEVT
jgi:hypothetical protein